MFLNSLNFNVFNAQTAKIYAINKYVHAVPFLCKPGTTFLMPSLIN